MTPIWRALLVAALASALLASIEGAIGSYELTRQLVVYIKHKDDINYFFEADTDYIARSYWVFATCSAVIYFPATFAACRRSWCRKVAPSAVVAISLAVGLLGALCTFYRDGIFILGMLDERLAVVRLCAWLSFPVTGSLIVREIRQFPV